MTPAELAGWFELEHGRSETGIHVVQGHPSFVFLDHDEEIRLDTSPGDYIYVPPWVPHREENPDPEEEAIVVNLSDLRWVGPVATGTASPARRDWHTY